MRSFISICFVICLLLGAVSAAHAGLITGKDAGIRGGYYNDAESSYIGVGLNLHFLRFNLNPNYEYVHARLAKALENQGEEQKNLSQAVERARIVSTQKEESGIPQNAS